MVHYLYTNTVLDGCVTLCVCPFAIETTFPLSNFKTKHIFGILVERVTFLKPFGAPQAPPERGARCARNLGHRWRPKFFFFFFYRRLRRRKLTPRTERPQYGALRAPQIFYIYFSVFSFIAAKGGGHPNVRRRHLNRGPQGA